MILGHVSLSSVYHIILHIVNSRCVGSQSLFVGSCPCHYSNPYHLSIIICLQMIIRIAIVVIQTDSCTASVCYKQGWQKNFKPITHQSWQFNHDHLYSHLSYATILLFICSFDPFIKLYHLTLFIMFHQFLPCSMFHHLSCFMILLCSIRIFGYGESIASFFLHVDMLL